MGASAVMKKTFAALGALILLSSTAIAGVYSDGVLARGEVLSPFDRAYEAGRAQSVTQPADYIKSQENAAPAAVLDLSRDDPISSIEETQTERTYRETINQLDQSKLELKVAREQAAQKLVDAQAQAEKAAQDRKASLAKAEQELRSALNYNLQAQSEVERTKSERLANISAIQTESDRLLMMAAASAEIIETQAKKRVTLERIDPTVVLNEPVSAEYQGATLEEIARGLMPVGWRVKADFTKKPELYTRRYEFVTTDSRDVAMRKLVSSVRDARVRFQYFWDLTDQAGNPAPMIILTDRPN